MGHIDKSKTYFYDASVQKHISRSRFSTIVNGLVFIIWNPLLSKYFCRLMKMTLIFTITCLSTTREGNHIKFNRKRKLVSSVVISAEEFFKRQNQSNIHNDKSKKKKRGLLFWNCVKNLKNSLGEILWASHSVK